MKKTKKLSYFVIAAASVLMCACQASPIEEEGLFANEAQVAEIIKDGKLYTLNEFVDAFMTEEGNYHSDTTNYRTRSHIAGKDYWLFTIDTLPTNGPGIYIRGRVSTDDYGGNFYKSLVIQQVVEGKQQALRLSVDAGSVSGMYPRGQEILIRCNGLAVGKYANQVQLCVPSHNNNSWAYNYDQKVGWAAGRIPFARFKSATTRIGLPDESKLVTDVITLTDIFASPFALNLQKARYEDGKLVKINNIYYSGAHGQYWNFDEIADCTTGDPKTDTNANVFAPTTDNTGYPQARLITDGGSYHLGVSMSEYAKEARFYLPDSIYVGSVTGILSCYLDDASKEATTKNSRWSITICDLDDLELYSKIDGSKWVPQEYDPSKINATTEEE